MRAVIQRVSKASVTVEGETIGAIGPGFLVLLGAEVEDTETDLNYILDKVLNLRVFDDDAGKLNLSLLDVGGALLVVSQFTLLGNCRKGRRPSFVRAMPPAPAEQIVEKFVERVKQRGVEVATGRFGAHMHLDIQGDGPVTILLDSRKQL